MGWVVWPGSFDPYIEILLYSCWQYQSTASCIANKYDVPKTGGLTEL